MNLGKTLLTYLPSVVLPGLLKWLSVPLFTHILLVDQYAILALALATAGMLSSTNSWVGMAVLRFYPEYSETNQGSALLKKLISISVIAAILIGTMAILVFNFAGEYNQFGLSIAVGILSVFIATELTTVLQYALRIQGRVTLFGLSALWKSLSLIAGGYIVYLIWANTASAILWGYAFGLIAGIPPIVYITLRGGDNIALTKGSGKAILKRAAYYGLPLMGAELAVWGLRFSDRWILASYTSDLSLAQYDATYNIIEASVMVLVAVFQMAIRPYEITKWRTQTKDEVIVHTSNMIKLFIVAIIPMAGIFAGVGSAIVRLVLPVNYWPGAVIIPWIALSVVFLGLQQRLQSILVYNESTMNIGIGAGLALTFNIVANIITVPMYGYIAAGINTAVGYGIFCLYVLIVASRSGMMKFPLKLLIQIISGSSMIFFLIKWIDTSYLVDQTHPFAALLITGILGSVLGLTLIYATGQVTIISKILKK